MNTELPGIMVCEPAPGPLRVCVNPMRAACGMQNRLIEYMAYGKVVIATSVANEGISGQLNALVIGDDAATFVDTTIGLLNSLTRAKMLGRAAREYVAKNRTRDNQFEKRESVFSLVLAECRVCE